MPAEMLSYKLILSPEAQAILKTDFSKAQENYIYKTLKKELVTMPNRFPSRYSARLRMNCRTVKVIYTWAFKVDNSKQIVRVLYGGLVI